jgi:hypothetical protein
MSARNIAFDNWMDSGQKTLGIVGEPFSFFDLHPHPSNKVAWLQIPAKYGMQEIDDSRKNVKLVLSGA